MFLEKFSQHNKQITIVPNKYEDRSVNAAECVAVLKKYYGKYFSQDFMIRKSEDIVTASKLGKPLAFFAKSNSNALEDIVELMYYMINMSSKE